MEAKQDAKKLKAIETLKQKTLEEKTNLQKLQAQRKENQAKALNIAKNGKYIENNK